MTEEPKSEMPDAVYDPYKDYMNDLDQAHRAAQRALNALYEPRGPIRSFWHRRRLGKAQSILISMYVKEKRNQDLRN